MVLRSSSSPETPFAITFPLFICTGGSLLRSCSILSASDLHVLSCSAMFTSASHFVVLQSDLRGSMALKAFLRWTTSRGFILLTATFETSRSRSPICLINPDISSMRSLFPTRYCTISRRSFTGWISFKGSEIHLLRSLPPMGEMVRSITSISVLAPSNGE